MRALAPTIALASGASLAADVDCGGELTVTDTPGSLRNEDANTGRGPVRAS
jgi:hypothetical protein